jgi:glycerol-3-phosphate acyltransferase PlsY
MSAGVLGSEAEGLGGMAGVCSVVVSEPLRLGAALLLGSIPVSNIISLVIAKQDLRYVGTGTVSSSNLYQAGGIGPFAASCALDIGKGAISATLVRGGNPALAVAAAGLTLVGHNWSLFQGGAGGRGVLPAVGILTVAAPSGAALVAGAIVGGFAAGDTAPGCFAAQLLLAPVLAAAKGREGALLGLALAAPMLAKRLSGNSRRAGRSWRVGNSRLTGGHSWRMYVTRMIYDRDIRFAPNGGRYRQ